MSAQVHPAFRVITHDRYLQSYRLQVLPDHIEQIQFAHACRGISSQFNAGLDVFSGSFQIPPGSLGVVFQPSLVFFAVTVQAAGKNAVHQGSFAVIQFIHDLLPVDRHLDRFADPGVVQRAGVQIHHHVIGLHTSLGNQMILPLVGFVDRFDRICMDGVQIEQIQLPFLEGGIHECRIKNQEPGLFDRGLFLLPVRVQFQCHPFTASVFGHHIGA